MSDAKRVDGGRATFARCAMALLTVAGIGACDTAPGFIAGMGSTLGTINYQGVNYTVQTDASGKISRIILDDGSSIDINGANPTFNTPDGGMFGFTNNGNGTVTVVFNLPGLGSGQFNVNGPTNARVKGFEANHDSGGTTAASACAELAETCENISFFLEVVFPIIRSDVIDAIVHNQAGSDPLAQTIARPLVEAAVDSEINKALNFCAGVQLIALVGAPPCDQP